MKYARVKNGEIVETLELDPNWIEGLEKNNNPKRSQFYSLTVDSVPEHDDSTHYIVPVYTIGDGTVHQSWEINVIEDRA
jgi:hypothetical protein